MMSIATPSSQRQWLFPSPLLRARQSRGHLTAASVGRAFKAWVAQIGAIDSELLGPDGTPAPFDPSLITPYALRHSYAQRHADGGVPVDVLKELMDHAAVATTMGYYNPRELHQAGDNLQVACWEWYGNAGAERPRHAA